MAASVRTIGLNGALVAQGTRALVLDANSLGYQLHEVRLQRIAKWSRDRGTNVIVPLPVVWEWSEHAHQRANEVWEGLQQAHRKLPRGLRKLLPDVNESSEPPTIEDVVAELGAVIEQIDNITIETPRDPKAWQDAVGDQILVRNLGERRSGVKTGAADTVVAAVVQDALDEFDTVVVWTSDGALAATCEEAGAEVARDYQHVLRLLLNAIPSDDVLEVALLDALKASIEEEGGRSHRFGLGGEGFSIVGLESREWRDPVQEDVEIDRIDDLAVRLDDAFKDEDDEITVTADVNGQAVVTVMQWFVDHNGALVDEMQTIDAWLSVPIVAYWVVDDPGEHAKRAEETLTAVLPDADFDYEAADICLLTAR